MAVMGRRFAQCRRLVLPIAFLAAIGALWEVGAPHWGISHELLPIPSAIAAALVENFEPLVQQALPTLGKIVAAYALATIAGIAIGTAIALSRRVKQAVFPYILAIQLMPKAALAPLFVIWFGVGPQSSLVFAVFLGMFPVLLSTEAGLRSAETGLIRLCDSYRASSLRIFWHVRLPFAAAHIVSGMKVAVTLVLTGVILGEFVAAQSGLGLIVLFAVTQSETALLFAAVLLYCAIGVMLFAMVIAIERLIVRLLGVTLTSAEFS